MSTKPTQHDVEKCEDEFELLRSIDGPSLPQKPETALHYLGHHGRNFNSSNTSSTHTSSQSNPSPHPPSRHRHDHTAFNRKALLTTLGGFLALFIGFGQMNAFGTFQTYYANHQLHAYTPSKISWIGSLQLWVFFFSGWGIGWLFDIHGPTRLLFMGNLCCCLGLLMMSFATKYYQLVLCQGVLFGFGVGLLFYPSLASISSHFMKYRATALGVAAAGSSLGGVIFPVILQQLYISVGFGWAVRIVALISGMLGLISVLTVTTAATAAPTSASSDPRHENENDTPIPNPPRTNRTGEGWLRLMKTTGLLTLACWLNARSMSGVMVYTVLYGFTSGAFIAVITPCVVQITEDKSEVGRRIGGLYSVISIPALIGTPIAGALLGTPSSSSFDPHSFTLPIVFSGTTVIVGSVFLLFAKLAVEPKMFARV
ncbi:hypothetical protein E1B28_013031 [Marasmius oreades]|uniref:MFS general substrate transporter n=1 Tax=Marasmius oreades TaxID=181124 RepID=A0A9P7RPF8_9AGAR|nr:uncharacterized protein E1B28_013031 [Marasmius oreades]KAG7087052.1 hypothetical protein E1B28_013031 [Marasmius oreades]